MLISAIVSVVIVVVIIAIHITTPENLMLRQLRKMRVTKDDILILTGHFDHDSVNRFAEKIKGRCGTLILLEPGQSLKYISEQVMNTYGWYKK